MSAWGPAIFFDDTASDIRGEYRELLEDQVPAAYRVARHRKKTPDWNDSGFLLEARVPPRPGDETAQGWVYLEWTGLAQTLERELTT